jgi:hypothetical protein
MKTKNLLCTAESSATSGLYVEDLFEEKVTFEIVDDAVKEARLGRITLNPKTIHYYMFGVKEVSRVYSSLDHLLSLSSLPESILESAGHGLFMKRMRPVPVVRRRLAFLPSYTRRIFLSGGYPQHCDF